MKKHIEKQVDKLKQNEGIFPKNLLNDLITYKLKEIIQLQDIIKSNELDFKSNHGNIYNFSKLELSVVF